MAKMNRKEVIVNDLKENKSYTVQAEQTPRKTEPGVYLYLKINQLGIEYLQNQKGLVDETVSTSSFRKYFCAKTGMPETGIGALGSLKNEEANEHFQVLVGGEQVYPSSISNVAVADTAKTKEIDVGQILKKLQEYKASGKYTDKQIAEALVTKLGPEQAANVLIQANAEQPKTNDGIDF